MSIFKACDIRGVVDVQWNETDAEKIGRALGQLMRRADETTICLGGDFRRSTPRLKRSLTDGLLEFGVHVVDIGQQPTPVVYFASRHLRCRNVAIVTASHNPGRYNGIKFLLAGRPPDTELMRRVEQICQAQICQTTPPGESTGSRDAGTVDSCDVLADYERWVIRGAAELVSAGPVAAALDDHRRVGDAPLSVIVDAMEGAFTHIAPRVLDAAGYVTTSLSPELDPDFSRRSPNPSSDANLQQLVATVVDRQADMGIALDGDGDRVVLVDNTGRIVRPEQLAVLIQQQCFRQPTVVYDLKSASILARAVEASGGTACMRPSGYGFIKATMLDTRAEMGVEASGHHFFGILDGGDDGLFTALVALEIVRQTGKSLATLIEPIGWPAITPDLRVPFSGDATSAIEAIAGQCGGQISRLDGVRAQYEQGWALARPSITEPAITLRFEGRTNDDLRQIASRFLAATPDLLSHVLEKI